MYNIIYDIAYISTGCYTVYYLSVPVGEYLQYNIAYNIACNI